MFIFILGTAVVVATVAAVAVAYIKAEQADQAKYDAHQRKVFGLGAKK